MWGHDDVPTQAQGHGYLREVEVMCADREQKRRERAFRDARRFISRAPPGGYPSTMRPFYGKDDAYRNARVDLEIYGLAFRRP
jgi:hypothetical protein